MQKALMIQLGMGLLIGGSIGALLGYFGKCTSGACPLTANPYRGAFIGALMGGVLAFSTVSSRTQAQVGAGGPTMHIDTVADFQSHVLNAGVPVLVDFYSNSCPPCRMLSPIIDQLAEEYEGRAVVAKINVAKAHELAGQYGIQAIPAVVFFHHGQETQRLIGLRSKETYAGVLDRMIPSSAQDTTGDLAL